jgi:hypothetical protein
MGWSRGYTSSTLGKPIIHWSCGKRKPLPQRPVSACCRAVVIIGHAPSPRIARETRACRRRESLLPACSIALLTCNLSSQKMSDNLVIASRMVFSRLRMMRVIAAYGFVDKVEKQSDQSYRSLRFACPDPRRGRPNCRLTHFLVFLTMAVIKKGRHPAATTLHISHYFSAVCPRLSQI